MFTLNQQTLAKSGAFDRPLSLEKGSYMQCASQSLRFLDNKKEEGERMRCSIDIRPYERKMIPNPNKLSDEIPEPITEFMKVAGAEKCPSMLDKTIYNSWQSHMLLYLKGKKNELSKQEKLQDDCDVQALNIVLQGLPPDVYDLVNHCQAAKEIWDIFKLLMQGT
ncbi:hypothetical protein Tco_1045801 [Tanacetum coccineum]|uniref:Integrase, catalytic region, zinc finger, CCHC-type, peptidase aspartic, catalytic n=1 Tax=Tanacetum coccineum TaxID=301880 RepID=A0ABQ5GUZ5_9ASTR